MLQNKKPATKDSTHEVWGLWMEFALPGCVVQLRRQIGDEGMGCVEEPMGNFRRKSPHAELVGKILLEESQQVSTSNHRCKYILQKS
jgi:hypothetical protein